ncbi:MAG: folate-binding protein YgfZ [Myxococcota bacterium]
MTPRKTFAGLLQNDIVQVGGKDRVDLLHRLSTNDLEPLATTGQVRSTLFTTSQGRLIDWVTVVAAPEVLLLVASPGRGQRIADWVDTYTIMEDVQSKLVSSAKAHIVVDGPNAEQVVSTVFGDVGTLSAESARQANDGWIWRGLAAYGPRFELLVDAAQAQATLQRLRAVGALAADQSIFERLRVDAGVPGPATEYPDDVNPLELRLGPVAVSFRKGCYIGQEVISRLDSYDKVARLLVGFSVEERAAARVAALPDGERKLTRDNKPFGRVTSLVGGKGLAVVKREGSEGGPAELVAGDMRLPVQLEPRPFF